MNYEDLTKSLSKSPNQDMKIFVLKNDNFLNIYASLGQLSLTIIALRKVTLTFSSQIVVAPMTKIF